MRSLILIASVFLWMAQASADTTLTLLYLETFDSPTFSSNRFERNTEGSGNISATAGALNITTAGNPTPVVMDTFAHAFRLDSGPIDGEFNVGDTVVFEFGYVVPVQDFRNHFLYLCNKRAAGNGFPDAGFVIQPAQNNAGAGPLEIYMIRAGDFASSPPPANILATGLPAAGIANNFAGSQMRWRIQVWYQQASPLVLVHLLQVFRLSSGVTTLTSQGTVTTVNFWPGTDSAPNPMLMGLSRPSGGGGSLESDTWSVSMISTFVAPPPPPPVVVGPRVPNLGRLRPVQ